MLSNLPRDLAEEVLLKLPLKSLRAVRFVSKTWNTLSKSQSFTKKHLAQEATSSEREFMMVMVIHNRLYLMSINLHGIHNNIDPLINFQGKLVSLRDSDRVNTFEVYHCDGLLLCIRRYFTRFVVWNPYCGQTRWFDFKETNWNYFAIGYETRESSSRSYKVLRFGKIHSNYIRYEIYYINSKSSRDITLPITISADWNIHFYARGVSFKGNTYWIAHQDNFRTSDFLLCFDFTSERFGPRLSLPFRSVVGDTVTISSVRDEKLAVLFQRWDNLKLEIWITIKIELEAVSWKKFLAVDMEPPYDWKFPVAAGSFFVDEDKKVVVVFNKDPKDSEMQEQYIAYIIGEDGYFKTVDFWKAPDCSFHPHMCPYVPSLVQIKEPAGDCKRKKKQC